jgi:hypothetical protein
MNFRLKQSKHGTGGQTMGFSGSFDITKPLVCPKCGKEPKFTAWEHLHNGTIIFQLGCCREVGFGRRHTKQSAIERWNTMVLEYALSHCEKEGK